jgi:hypothetical protein
MPEQFQVANSGLSKSTHVSSTCHCQSIAAWCIAVRNITAQTKIATNADQPFWVAACRSNDTDGRTLQHIAVHILLPVSPFGNATIYHCVSERAAEPVDS